jgi:hypothetical protein
MAEEQNPIKNYLAPEWSTARGADSKIASFRIYRI